MAVRRCTAGRRLPVAACVLLFVVSLAGAATAAPRVQESTRPSGGPHAVLVSNDGPAPVILGGRGDPRLVIHRLSARTTVGVATQSVLPSPPFSRRSADRQPTATTGSARDATVPDVRAPPLAAHAV